MKDKIGDKQRLQHIIEAITEIESYVEVTDINSFGSNKMMMFATIKLLEIVGEASNHITAKTKDQMSGINWTQIIGMRNILVHEYFGIDMDVIWEIMTRNLPELKSKVSAILDTL